MSVPGKAVFLSSSSQDAEAARRICDSLRAGGVEVWFDADGGLEHGDEWDAKIRRQIKECVLFIPLISASTQARLEGYFRIEWELAAERAMGIAAGVPFILPVVIDDTREPDALVPDRFRKVQWTRIAEGRVSPDVQTRLLKLWSHRTGARASDAARASSGGSVSRPATGSGFSGGRGLAAVVFTDIVGYSARMQRDETGTMELVQADFALMKERCTAHGGEVLNTMGDGLLMCFSSAVQAVTCALQIQSEFGVRRDLLPPEQTLEHRMGVHIGDVFRQETGGVAGDGVNIASRLEGKAPAGGVCISQMVYDTVKGKVPMQAAFIGPETFKNITEAIPIWHIAPADAAMPTRPPTAGRKPHIPDYELLRQIGRGSYGDVWLARGATGLWRAIKVVWRERFGDAEPFEREWRGLKEFAAISLGESAQMALLHVGRNDEAGFFYYVMELADDAERGRAIEPVSYVPLTLTQLRARRTRLPADECVRYGAELARVLAGLHRRGLVHRDIKPSNVILVDGVPKLADIGLVAPTTSARTFVGTEGFVPPEGPGAPSADVFALGKVLYELATGHDRQDFPQLPPNLGSQPDHRALLALNAVIMRACESSSAKRYRDAAEMLVDLEALQAGRAVPRPRRGLWLTLAAAAVALAATGLWLTNRRPVAPTKDRPEAKAATVPGKNPSPTKDKADPRTVATAVIEKPRGIAVLPFENLDAADQAFFAGGVTEEIFQHLAKVRALRVMSQAAVARFRGGVAELPAMARELGIGAVLTGSVRRAGDVVRISVQLLAAPSGETLWTEQYDRPAKDIFAVQSEVAKSVLRALQTALSPHERTRIERPPTADIEAFTLYLQAGRARSARERIDLLNRAVALDPKFALAYCGLSFVHVRLADTTGRDDKDRALAAARTAVALDPQLAAAHYNLGNALGSFDQIDAARLSHLRAIELNPSFASAFNDLSALEANAGRMDQSFYWAKRSFPLAPNIAYTWYHVAGPLMMLDEPAGESWLRAGIARFPANDRTGVFRLHILLACIEFTRGQPEAAMERMRKLAADQPANSEVRTVLTELAVFTGAADAVERVDAALKVGPGAHSGLLSYSPRALRAFLWTKVGDREQARSLIDAALAANRAAMEKGDKNYPLPHENAALHLMLGDRAAALDSLEAAVNAGFLDAGLLKVNPLMAPLADEPRFRQAVDRIERSLREMRARVDLSDLDELAKTGRL